jgi:Domain of unknown function (DUF1772)
LTLDDSNLLKQWKPSYDAGYTMQASLAAVSAVLGLLAAWSSADWRWIVGAILIFANWPYTLIVMMPTNNRLKAIPACRGDGCTRRGRCSALLQLSHISGRRRTENRTGTHVAFWRAALPLEV